MEENKDLNEVTPEMSVEQPVPTAVPEPTPAAEPQPEQEGNGDTITFDYNQLYKNPQDVPQQSEQEVAQPQENVQEAPIVFESEQAAAQPTTVVKNIVPTFDTNALENDLPDELKPTGEEPLIHTMATETQKEKQESYQNIIFILIFFAVLIIAVLVIFPKMLGI